MVSTALRVTGTAARSGTIRGEEYDVNEIAGSENDRYRVGRGMHDVNAKYQAITNTCACARFGVLIASRPLFSSPFTWS